MINVNDIYTVRSFDVSSKKFVLKAVKVIDILDGPASDKRDYCTLEGLHDWECEIPVDHLVDMIKDTREFIKENA